MTMFLGIPKRRLVWLLGGPAIYHLLALGAYLCTNDANDTFHTLDLCLIGLIALLGMIGVGHSLLSLISRFLPKCIFEQAIKFRPQGTIRLVVFVYLSGVGFTAFCFSIASLIGLASVLTVLMSCAIQCFKVSWEERGGNKSGETQTSTSLAVFTALLIGLPMQLVNFVSQAVLITCALCVLGTRDPAYLKKHIQEGLMSSFDITAELPAVDHLLELCATVATSLEHVSAFTNNSKEIWTTKNIMRAYVSVAVFEIAIVDAVFVIAMSGILLIVAPGDGLGWLGFRVSDFVARFMVYLLQVLVFACSTPFLTLCNLHSEHPGIQQILNKGPMLPMGVVFACMCWSGIVDGLQYTAQAILDVNVISAAWDGLNSLRGRHIKMKWVDDCLSVDGHASTVTSIIENYHRPTFLAFLGIWTQSALDAFKVRQRVQVFSLREDKALLAIVNSISMPLYLFGPFGAVVAKFGEYLNQNPIYVAGRGFSLLGLSITLTYIVEYVMVLVVAKKTLDTIELGPADHAEVKSIAGTDGHFMLKIIVGLSAIVLVRVLLTAVQEKNASSRTMAIETFEDVDIKACKADATEGVETNCKATALLRPLLAA